MTRQLTFMQAGELLANKEFRKAITGRTLTAGLRRVAPSGEAEAAITDDNVLIITGSDGIADYTRYNLRPGRFVPVSKERRQIAKVMPYSALHGGFLLHATEVLRFLGDEKPDFIVGHSLGAASAQILGTVLKVPAICFASPQVIRRKYLKGTEWRLESHPQWNVYNVAWNHDLVTRGYRFLGMRCLGFRAEFRTRSGKIGLDHFAKDYKEMIEKDSNAPVPGLPAHWRMAGYGVPSTLA